MSTIEIVYVVSLCLGLGFTLLSGLMAGVFSGGAEAQVDVGGGQADLGSGAEGHVAFPLLSPVTLSMFVASFGAAGLIFMKALGWPFAGHVGGALLAATALGLATATLLYKLFKATSAGSAPDGSEAVGQDAEVTLAIPHAGLGEIAYVIRGSRFTSPARCADGKELPASTPVKIVQLVGTTYLVEKIR